MQKRSDEEDQVGLKSIPHLNASVSVRLGLAFVNFRKNGRGKEMLSLIPLWAASLPFAIAISQSATLFTKQGITMDRSITPSVDLPAASLQYIIGLIGLQELFYDRVPCSLKSRETRLPRRALTRDRHLSIADLRTPINPIGGLSYQEISSKNGGNGWFSDNTNRAHLDYFYWLLASLNAIGFVAFLYFAKSYKNRSELVVIIVNY
ncbi:hypothetical protein SASPL_115614 [Salvia splendens]|uniref:Solute carrier family 15 (Peptide/histidine transporter), member 3/4 n=1 Tax=Salvia splendens TaxID=180675 RepID=A0A8X9A1T0_SALSN|nr:hypothetical protein SASPL_115614 [Salvia splendens]